MKISPDIANFATLASFILAVLAGGAGIWRHIEKRQHSFEVQQHRIADKLDAMLAQFGPNGGGLRQAVNEMSRKIDKIEERQIIIGDKVAHLQGEFDQHVENN